METYERVKPPYILSTDRGQLDFAAVHSYLSNQSYWAKGLAPDRLRRSIEHSLTFGVYDDANRQVGFARVVTDTTSVAYMLDVFILPDYQGRGIGSWLVQCILEHPDLVNVKTWMLKTHDAHDVYRKFGFRELEHVEHWMERKQADLVTQAR